jgi:hypothetical protein
MKKVYFMTILVMFISLPLLLTSQTVLWQSGFETGDSSPTISITTAQSHGVQGSGGNYGAKCWRIVSTDGGGKTYDGSVITGLLSFNSARYYRATVYARIGTTGNGNVADVGTLKIVKSSTATNAAMKAASGADILLATSNGNVDAVNYIKFQVNFTVSSNESKYIGFQLFQNFSAKMFMEIDDIKIEESFSPFVPVACNSQALSTLDSYISNVTFNGINNPSTDSRHYTDFSNVSTVVNINSTYGMSVSKSQSGATPFTGRFAAWIDWNQNGSFDANELVLSDAIHSHGPVTANVTVPSGALLGRTQMRVIFREGSLAPVSCGRFAYGETEDYTIFVEDEIIVLPVTLTKFETQCNEDGQVMVSWETASESNSSHFILEHSRDGKQWFSTALVQAAGFSNVQQDYAYNDLMASLASVQYYRLVQVDLDGKSTTYNPIMVSCMGEKESTLSVQPNPTAGNAQFTASGFNSGSAQFCIQDVSGKRIVERQLELNNGTIAFTADLSSCAPGIYIAKLIDQNGESKTVRIIKD